ncbi:hypothetical protein DICA3_E28568 [Diutina catenulata]
MPTYANSTAVSGRIFRSQRIVIMGVFAILAFILCVTAFSGRYKVAHHLNGYFGDNSQGDHDGSLEHEEDLKDGGVHEVFDSPPAK